MKTLSLTIALAFIALFGFAQSNSAFACSSCGCSGMKAEKPACTKCAEAAAHHGMKKEPCAKCAEAGKTCNCMKAKSCGCKGEKAKGECTKCKEAAAHHAKKSKCVMCEQAKAQGSKCVKCAEAKAYYDNKKKSKSYSKSSGHSEIINGRITRPAGNWSSGSTSSSYND